MNNKGTAVITALTYETNGKKKDFNLTPGDNLTLNWGLSQFFPLKKDMSLLLEVGPAGYDTWQGSLRIPAATPAALETKSMLWAVKSA